MVRILSKLSDKEILAMLSEFPRHELTTKQRTDLLKVIGESSSYTRKFTFNFQKIAAFAAMLFLIIIAPILYFTHEDETTPKTGTVIKDVKNGDYFGLIDKNGTSHYVDSNFGIPNKVSLLAPKEWVAKDYRSVGKIMIFLWGEDKDFANKPLQIDAINIKTGIKEHLATAVVSGGMYGADAHAVTSFKQFDLPGKWNLEFTAGGRKVGEFAIYVKEPYIKIGNSTLMISKEGLYAGFYEAAYIEVEGEHLPPEIELEVVALENGEVSTFTFKDKTDYITTDGKKISMYKGDFNIKKSGRYRFSVLKQSQAVEVRKPLSN